MVQNQRRLKSKGVRESASKSREALLTERAAAASKLREGKRSLAEEHKQRMQADYLNKVSRPRRRRARPAHGPRPTARPHSSPPTRIIARSVTQARAVGMGSAARATRPVRAPPPPPVRALPPAQRPAVLSTCRLTLSRG